MIATPIAHVIAECLLLDATGDAVLCVEGPTDARHLSLSIARSVHVIEAGGRSGVLAVADAATERGLSSRVHGLVDHDGDPPASDPRITVTWGRDLDAELLALPGVLGLTYMALGAVGLDDDGEDLADQVRRLAAAIDAVRSTCQALGRPQRMERLLTAVEAERDCSDTIHHCACSLGAQFGWSIDEQREFEHATRDAFERFAVRALHDFRGHDLHGILRRLIPGQHSSDVVQATAWTHAQRDFWTSGTGVALLAWGEAISVELKRAA